MNLHLALTLLLTRVSVKEPGQQNVCAMVRCCVAQSFYLRSTFGFVGQDAASKSHHCANTNVGGNFFWDILVTNDKQTLGTFFRDNTLYSDLGL